MQYDMTPPRTGSSSGSANGSATVTGPGTGDTAVKAVQKWRIHFAKPPKSATMAMLAKPVTTEALVRNLELDEEAVCFQFFLYSFFLLTDHHANAGSYNYRVVPSRRAFPNYCTDKTTL